ncbi:MAG TPA: hypothetical protein VHD35_05945 [Chitinophagaceae bacterium]|jgi:flavin reductase (DIM6/NTAB) family NADH-FMN oxidoreductase RutF|nr:hypothetical protein [Chitinophagaceae bacterium]
MKHFLKELFYKDIQITEYSGITVTENIHEKVYFKIGKKLFEVTQDHWVLCLEPLVFGIWLPKNKIAFDPNKNHDYSLYFKELLLNEKEKKLAVAKVKYFDRIDEQDGSLLLMKLNKSKISHTNLMETRFLFSKYYKKPGFVFKKFKAYVSGYSYPRKVRIISFKDGDYYNIFPMDLLGNITESKKFVFGLRHTNHTLAKIIENKKIVVSEIPCRHKTEVYDLGKHHSSKPPSPDKLPFKIFPSKNFEFPITEWAEKYYEIKIIHTLNLGSHMLLWGEIQHEEILKKPESHFYHIHFMLHLYQKRKGINYQLV